ncbi:MAG: hypothetical protein HUK20_12795 [Fibrobacter sp.]|nr:hypothetical protein [Fibrobacter sp.]
MNQQVADIALMMVLPLGITFTAILQTATAETRTQKILGALLSLAIVIMDCIFYFFKNTFITYNCDGGLLLSFASLIFFGLIFVIRNDDLATKVGFIFFCVFMASGFLGIAYWDRPTFILTSDASPAEIAAQNARFQDYIASFAQNESNNAYADSYARVHASGKLKTGNVDAVGTSTRLDTYVAEAEKAIRRMQEINAAIDEFGALNANITENDREIRSNQALAINNNATALNRKVLGLFHPHESSEAHSELIQASESIRLAAYSLYNYTLLENPEEQLQQYKQSRSQISQMKSAIARFWNDISNLRSNNQQQNETQGLKNDP